MFGCLESFAGPIYLWPRIYDPYRDDPRWHALMRKWNLEDAQFATGPSLE